jgi:type I restriction enzyme S subunit
MNGWPVVPLSSFLRERRESPKEEDLETGATRIISKIRFDGTIEFRVTSETKTNMILAYPGDLVISGINAAKGAIAILNEQLSVPVAATIHYGAYSINTALMNPSYLWWYLRSAPFREELLRANPGGIKSELKAGRLLPLGMPLPPLEEQILIVDLITRLAEDIAQVSRRQTDSASAADSLVFSICERALNDLEADYPTVPLAELVDATRGISYGVIQTGTPTPNGVSTLRAGDLRWFFVDTRNVKRINPAIDAAYQRTHLQGGELLLRIRGGVGELAVCPPEMVGGNVSREIAVIPLKHAIVPEYVMYILAAPANQKRLLRDTKGTSYVGVNLADVRKLLIPIAPKARQVQVVERIDALRSMAEALKALYAQTRVTIDAIIPSVLDRAFRGELTNCKVLS